MVATNMLEKLGLKRLKHPTPYKVSWLHKGHQLLVDEQCEVEFHIVKYRDMVTCDIMPMDVCHILLGSSMTEKLFMTERQTARSFPRMGLSIY